MALAHQLIVTVMAAAVLAACMANPNWNWNPCPPKKIVVGGSENWRFGFNYADWALKNGPFYLNDVLGESSLIAFFLQLKIDKTNSPYFTILALVLNTSGL